MTLEELEDTLPNGLHDAEVKSIIVDYQMRNLTLEVCIWIGDMSDPPEKREAYRNARLSISGLLFLIAEAPDPGYPFKTGHLTIDGCDSRENLDAKLLDSLPQDAFFRSLYVSDWNAFIHIAARDARIIWSDEPVKYRRGIPERQVAPG